MKYIQSPSWLFYFCPGLTAALCLQSHLHRFQCPRSNHIRTPNRPPSLSAAFVEIQKTCLYAENQLLHDPHLVLLAKNDHPVPLQHIPENSIAEWAVQRVKVMEENVGPVTVANAMLALAWPERVALLSHDS